MKRSIFFAAFIVTATVIVFGLISMNSAVTAQQDMPFGQEDDIAFANKVWKAIEGYETWPMISDFYPGRSPHGKVLRLTYNVVNIDGEPYHIIIKDNYGGEGVNVEKVANADSPEDYLGAVTIMLQREEGYDPENNNWFWAKYLPDGTLDKNPKGMSLAGRVAKGMNAGCIACHSTAKDDDMLFVND